jgi:hypothetical protein
MALPESVHIWFVLPAAHVQICILFPSAVTPLLTSRHLVSKIFRFAPETVQPCEVEPPDTQSSISTTAPSVLEAAVRHFPELALGWINVPVGVGPVGCEVVVEEEGVDVVEEGGADVVEEGGAVGVEEGGAVVLEEKTGVPVLHAIRPPQASSGSGVPSHVQED